MNLLDIAVGAGASGPVVKLTGESDLTIAGQLRNTLTAHLALHDAGGTLDLLVQRQSEIARTLSLFGADQVLTIRVTGGTGNHTVTP